MARHVAPRALAEDINAQNARTAPISAQWHDSEDTEEMDESKDPLEESGGTHSEESDDEIDESVAEDIQKFEDSFKGITRRYRLINRIGEGRQMSPLIRSSR